MCFFRIYTLYSKFQTSSYFLKYGVRGGDKGSRTLDLLLARQAL